MTVDWQTISLAVITCLCGIVWAEVRSLRKAKHSDAQVLQWCVFAIGIVAKKTGVELPSVSKSE